MDMRKSGRRYRLETPWGETVCGYTLYDEHGVRMGVVTLEYNNRERWGRLYSVTDYGNYSYEWPGIGERGFLRFLLNCDSGYLTGKLAAGHDEQRVLLVRETWTKLRADFLKRYEADDPDWLGSALAELDTCRCEADFYDWSQEYCIEDVYRYFAWGYGGYLTSYRDVLLPELKRVLKEEVDA